ncbi:Homoserine kinase [Castellaniella defragrans]
MLPELEKIFEPLKTPPPEVSAEQARKIALRHYGLSASATTFISERDRNFHLLTDAGEHYVLKVTNSAEDPQAALFQSEALREIARRDPALPVPRVVAALDGAHHFFLRHDGQDLLIRLFTYLEGESVAKVPHSARQRFNIGQLSARIARALQDFRHPADQHLILWDIQHAGHLGELLQCIPDVDKRTLAEEYLERFRAHVQPAYPELRKQAVHNDLNLQNLLVQPEAPDVVTGILDFGDMVCTALINDVAVTSSYLLATTRADPLAPVVEMLHGYQSIVPLEAAELTLLPDLIATRYLVNVAITNWRAARYPENKAYILRNTGPAWAGLRCLKEHSRQELQDYLVDACPSLN